ncbi:MAG TPA: hypothetical protein VFR47_30475 [Anaerolineales bacterium]|nr:hypothetical protein [Anaerolineales bacterium]
MIRFQRSGRIARGKDLQAIEWSKEVTAYLNGKFSEANLQVFSHRFGDIDTLAWQADFDSLASLDSYQRAINGDKEFWERLGKSTEFFVEGSFFDTVFETL